MPSQPDEWNEAIRHNQNLRHRDKQIEIHNNKREWLRRLSYDRFNVDILFQEDQDYLSKKKSTFAF